MLVFSQTSLQRRAINPRNPRAIFYNDDVYIGYIPDAPMMEISAVDPKLGGVFYSLDQVPRGKADVHAQPGLSPVPRLGTHARRAGAFRALAADRWRRRDRTPARTPAESRIARRSRSAGAAGTSPASTARRRISAISWAHPRSIGTTTEPGFRGNLPTSRASSTRSKYLRPRSDIVALMVLEHQAHMHNYITRLSYETRIMTATYGHIRYLKNQVNAFLRFLLFTEEAPLTAPVSGDPQYRRGFHRASACATQGPLPARPRFADAHVPAPVLRSSSTRRHSTKCPPSCASICCSGSTTFSPGKDADPQFAKIAASDRQAILEILRETKPNLPDYWRASPGTP